MWLGQTPLVPEDSLTVSNADRARMMPTFLRDEHVDAVRAFALGDSSVDLTRFTDPETLFIDVYATVRKFHAEFRPEHVLGLQPNDLVVDDWEGRGFGDTFLTTTWLTKPATPRRPERHIVWTLVWQRTGEIWELVRSQASAACGPPPRA